MLSESGMMVVEWATRNSKEDKRPRSLVARATFR